MVSARACLRADREKREKPKKLEEKRREEISVAVVLAVVVNVDALR